MIFIYSPPSKHHLIAIFFSKVNSQWWLDWCVESQEPASVAFRPCRLALCRVCSISRVRSSLHVRPSALPEPTTRKTEHSRWNMTNEIFVLRFTEHKSDLKTVVMWSQNQCKKYWTEYTQKLYSVIGYFRPVCINIQQIILKKKYLTQFWPNFFSKRNSV